MRLTISLIFVSSVLAGAAMAQDKPSANEPQGHFNTTGNIDAKLNYWTAERMQNAKPMPLPQLKAPAVNQTK